jgi:methionine-rich copper-binding protein CopC
VTRRLTAFVLAGLAIFAAPAPAWAHNTLVSSEPADKSSVATQPTQVKLVFDQPVQTAYNYLAVTGPDLVKWAVINNPEIAGNTVAAAIPPLGPTGEYTIGFHVVSADGHPVRGETKFTLTNPGTGHPVAGNAEPSRGGDDQQTSATIEAPIWPWLVGGIVLLVAGTFAALRFGRD